MGWHVGPLEQAGTSGDVVGHGDFGSTCGEPRGLSCHTLKAFGNRSMDDG